MALVEIATISAVVSLFRLALVRVPICAEVRLPTAPVLNAWIWLLVKLLSCAEVKPATALEVIPASAPTDNWSRLALPNAVIWVELSLLTWLEVKAPALVVDRPAIAVVLKPTIAVVVSAAMFAVPKPLAWVEPNCPNCPELKAPTFVVDKACNCAAVKPAIALVVMFWISALVSNVLILVAVMLAKVVALSAAAWVVVSTPV